MLSRSLEIEEQPGVVTLRDKQSFLVSEEASARQVERRAQPESGD